ncbi:hypothetical protein Tco_1199724, partial [Tanacetum coccineum]
MPISTWCSLGALWQKLNCSGVSPNGEKMGGSDSGFLIQGLGVVCNKEAGFSEDDFVLEFLGEVYPAWRWFKKQHGVRALQIHVKNQHLSFIISILRGRRGMVMVMTWLLLMQCIKPTMLAIFVIPLGRIMEQIFLVHLDIRVAAVAGQYQIGIYSVRPIVYEEEVTSDYNSITE